MARRKVYFLDEETVTCEEFDKDGNRRILAGEIDEEDPTVMHVKSTGHPYLIFKMKGDPQ